MDQPTATETQPILGDLKRLGFTESEARVYVALIGKSPATAYEVANRSGVPRPNTYSILKALAAKSAVMPVSSNPVRYVPQPADRLFRSIAADTRKLCDELADRIAAISVEPRGHYVWGLSGDAEVHGKILEMIAGAERTIWLKADAVLIRRHKESLRKVAEKRDVRIVIILYGDDPDEFRFTDACEVHMHEGSGFPMGFADNHFTLTVDNREMLTANLGDSVVATHTENEAIVKMAVSLLRHDFYMAEIFRVFGQQIDEQFGPNLKDLRESCYSAEQFAMFNERREAQDLQAATGRVSGV